MSTSTTTAPLVALITAGSAGLGAATARLFAREGIRVAINYGANAERADKLVDELSAISPDHLSAPNDFVAIRADLADRTAVRELVDETARRFGRLDVVFSNGGWTRPRDYANLDDNVEEEDWDRCFNMNVKSHLFLMHAAKPHLDAAHGVFITTASLAGVSATGSSLVSPRPCALVSICTDAMSQPPGLQRHQGSPDPPR